MTADARALCSGEWSGRKDSNLRPLEPHSRAEMLPVRQGTHPRMALRASMAGRTAGQAPARTWRLTPTGYASEDPTTRAAWMVQGETDAGPQRRCVACRQWWPLENAHWVRRPRAKGRTGYIQPCKACRVENGMADS